MAFTFDVRHQTERENAWRQKWVATGAGIVGGFPRRIWLNLFHSLQAPQEFRDAEVMLRQPQGHQSRPDR